MNIVLKYFNECNKIPFKAIKTYFVQITKRLDTTLICICLKIFITANDYEYFTQIS